MIRYSSYEEKSTIQEFIEMRINDRGAKVHQITIYHQGDIVGKVVLPLTDSRWVKAYDLVDIAYDKILQTQANPARDTDPREGQWDEFKVDYGFMSLYCDTQGVVIRAS
jgi:hypothetical protein